MSIQDAGVGDKRIFLRRASGLIRTAGTLDTFIYNIGLVSVGLGVGTVMLYGPAFYAGGSLLWAAVISGAVMALIAWGMITWTVTLPRSGGVYVFGSRILPPVVALTASLVEITTWLFYCAIAAYWIVLIGISPTLSIIGLVSGSEWASNAAVTVTEPWPLFLIGSGILIVSGLLIASGMKRYLLAQKFVFLTALAGSVLLIVVLAIYSNGDFITAFNTMMAPSLGVEDPYHAIIASAMESGWGYDGTSLAATIQVSNWTFLPLLGAAFSICIGGEIKSPGKAQSLGMLGAIAMTVVLWLITMSLANSVFGYDFLGAAGWNLFNGTGIATDPTITLMAGILTNSWVVTLLVAIGLVMWMWMWIPGMHTFGVRAMVAWSFDRVAPAPLGTVSQTRHTPTVAILVAVIITIIFMALFVFTSFFSTIIILIEAAVLAWSVILLAGVWFPFARKEIYEKSPIASKKILGLPMMSVACGFGFLGSQFYFWNLFFDSTAAGHEPTQLAIVGGIFVIGIVFYYTMKYIRKAQGYDVTLAFKEVPIE